LASLTADISIILFSTGWEGIAAGDEVIFSWAGEAARFISTPLFLFLVLRWLWRFFVWTVLLYRISRLPLQLTPLHPDRAGGLGFLSIYPAVFSGFIFALSCVIAAEMIKDIGLEDHSAMMVWFALAGWLLVSLGLVIGPLLVFARPLYLLREQGLIEYGRLASQHHLAFHQKWIEGGRSGKELLSISDPSSAADLNAIVEMVQGLRSVPVDFHAIVQALLSAGIPLLAVASSQVSLGAMLKWFTGAVL
jgi:hypothetical protein